LTIRSNLFVLLISTALALCPPPPKRYYPCDAGVAVSEGEIKPPAPQSQLWNSCDLVGR